MAVLAALAFASASASLMPSAIFWFGQITPQTLMNMIVASHMPTPMKVWLGAAPKPSAKPMVRASTK